MRIILKAERTIYLWHIIIILVIFLIYAMMSEVVLTKMRILCLFIDCFVLLTKHFRQE